MDNTSGRFALLAKNFKLSNLPESEVELVGEVPYETLAPYREAALTHIAEHAQAPGFRPGKMPKDMVLKKVGELAVLEEAAELFVKDFYPELIMEHKVEAVGRPDIRVTKLAPGNPLALAVRATVYPTVVVPKEWKGLHTSVVSEPAVPATDEEVAQTLEDLRKSRATKDGDKEALPELTDAFAKSIGAFDTLDALKAQIKKGITEEKERRAKDARRGKLIEALLAKVSVAVPRLFVESELEKIMSQMREDIARFGMTFEQYLERAQKTEEGIRNEFREQASKRAKLQMTLNKLAEEEGVEADQEAVAQEMKHALEHFPDAKQELVRIHIETVMRNEKVLKILEGSEDKKA